MQILVAVAVIQSRFHAELVVDDWSGAGFPANRRCTGVSRALAKR